ncbi:AA-permease domain-containing protein [Mycena indigotica]|uniref:AA-permease domain-containing protein n=1 Tax=Mycena indigotica TaxID=2126181 RepID=A0A8H6VYK0_9AGAR|nr:AA-permease domain-containing protein [Mycena indigotica]KAF7294978.1 AA-permease domain-containing protein [Mycena indigotica]
MSTITVDISAGIATICLNRPDSLNSLTVEDYDAFAKALRDIDKRDDVVVTVWQGTGKWFCAGTDVKTAGAAQDSVIGNVREAFLKAVTLSTTDCGQAVGYFLTGQCLIVKFFSLIALQPPQDSGCGPQWPGDGYDSLPSFMLNFRTITLAGIAAAFLGYFDFIYSLPNAWLSVPFTFIGIIAEGGSSVSFINRMGLAKANEALIWGKKKDAQELLQCGFINKIFPQQSVESFHKAVRALVLDDMEGLDPSAIFEVKRLLKKGLDEKNSMDAVNLRESIAQAERFASGIPARQFIRIANKEIRHKL